MKLAYQVQFWKYSGWCQEIVYMARVGIDLFAHSLPERSLLI